MDEGDRHGAIEFLEPWAEGNHDRTDAGGMFCPVRHGHSREKSNE
jgi:hypothetical protein